MSLICSECKDNLTYTYLINKCEKCNHTWQSNNEPIVKYCNTCASEENVCKICGTNLDQEFETSKFLNSDKLREKINYIDISTKNQLYRLDKQHLEKDNIIWLLSYLKSLDNSIIDIMNQLSEEVPNLNDFNHSFMGLREEDINYLRNKFRK